MIDRDDKKALDQKGIYAVRSEAGECMVKRVVSTGGEYWLVSDSPEKAKFKPVKAWTTDLDRLLIGKVIWAWKSLI